MKKLIITYGLGILLCMNLNSCDDYIRTEAVKEIYVNRATINGFIGDEVQLVASPTDGTYQYTWSSEDPKIATVSADGKVKLLGEGNTNIIVKAGDVQNRVEVYSVIRIELTDIILSESSLELTPGAKKVVNVQRVPDNANDIPQAIWSSENPKVATVNEKGEIVGVSEGNTNIRYTVGSLVKKVAVSVSFTRPFNGPHILKAGDYTEIKAADFDFGGQGYAFNDDAGNAIGNDNYRKGKGDSGSFPVEIEGDGTNIGYIGTGEWYQYTVDVQDAGKYQFEASLSAAADGKFHIEVDGVAVTPVVNVPSNGSWGAWRYFPVPPLEFNLAAGKRKIKFYVDASGYNLRALRFKKM